jgi:nitroreductase
MEFREVVRRRRMVRRFDPDRPVPAAALDEVLYAAQRAPSAGFSQGWDFVVLAEAEDRDRFWGAARDAEPPDGAPMDRWLAGVSAAPVLVLCLSDPDAYLDRYAEPDKGWTDRDPARWPVPYWDVDTGMAVMLMLLAAVDQGLGALFFGVPPARHEQVRRAHGIPGNRRLVGVVALGHELSRAGGSSRTRPRRTPAEVVHWDYFGGAGHEVSGGAGHEVSGEADHEASGGADHEPSGESGAGAV